MILNQIAAGGGGTTPAAPTEWVRPADWPALPAALTDDRFDGLLAIQDAPDGNVYAALSVTVVGGFTVSWGDGTTDMWASGATAQHVYSYADVDLGPVTERGYKTAIVTVTSTTPGSAWSAFSLQKRHSTLNQVTESGWLDVQLQAPSMTSLAVGASSPVRVAMLERVRLGTHSITNMSYMFSYCSSLASVPLFNTAAVTDMSYMFSYCSSLASVPLFNTANVTTMSSMFSSCYSLASVPLFNTANVTTMSSMFTSCTSLASVPLFNTAAVTNMSSMFSSCYSLASVPLFNTANVTTMSSMFTSCTSLASVPLFNTAAVTNMSSMFSSCYSLASGTLEGTRVSTSYVNCSLSATALDSIYTKLADVKAYTLTGAVGNGTTATYTTSVAHDMTVGQRITVTGIVPAGYNVTNALITAVGASTFTVARTETGAYSSGGSIAALTAITITITGNRGAAASTKTIATNKGWTVTN